LVKVAIGLLLFEHDGFSLVPQAESNRAITFNMLANRAESDYFLRFFLLCFNI